MAGRGQPGDEALLGGVAPVLGGDAAAGGDDFLVGHVDVVDGDAALQFDVVANEPAGAVQTFADDDRLVGRVLHRVRRLEIWRR
jgi:hypothetical protein